MPNSTLIVQVTSNSVKFTVNIAIGDPIKWSVRICAKNQKSRGGCDIYDYPYFYEDIDGSNTTSFTRTLSDDNYIATLYLSGVGYSDFAEFTVSIKSCPDITVTLSTCSSSKQLNESHYFTSTVSGGTAPIKYQWYVTRPDKVIEYPSKIYGMNYTFNQIGQYLITVAVADSCPSGAKSAVKQCYVNVTTATIPGEGFLFISYIENEPANPLPSQNVKVTVGTKNTGDNDYVAMIIKLDDIDKVNECYKDWEGVCAILVKDKIWARSLTFNMPDKNVNVKVYTYHWENNDWKQDDYGQFTVKYGSSSCPIPSAEFTFSPSNPKIGETVQFTDISIISKDYSISSWKWEFGDGLFSDLKNPTHQYKIAGTYMTSLEVINSCGEKGTLKKNITVGLESDLLIINTQKNLQGTIEKTGGCGSLGGWLWHLTAPVQKDIYYGCADTVPATWIDANGNEQMAVIKKGEWYPNDIALDYELSGGVGEQYVKLEDVNIIFQKAGYTTQIRYPKSITECPEGETKIPILEKCYPEEYIIYGAAGILLLMIMRR